MAFYKKNKKQTLDQKKQFKFRRNKNTNKPQKVPIAIAKKIKKRQFLIRCWVSFGVIGGCMLLVYLHDIYLQVYQNAKYELSSINNYIKIIPEVPQRGIITDRNGIGLAVNKLEYGLFINPISIYKAKNNFKLLQQIIPLDEDDWKSYIKRRQDSVFQQDILLKPDLTNEEIARIAVNKYRLPDISIHRTYTRYYPFGTALPHTLGYVAAINDRDKAYIESLPEREQVNYEGTSNIGKIGLEKYYESDLHGKVGYQTVEVNATGDIVKVIDQKKPVMGDNLRLSIDLPLQEYIRQLLVGQRAAVIVTDPKTSAVLAMVSNPSYDENLFVNGISYKNYDALLDDPNKPLYNRATMGIYAPGSTIKPFEAFSGLEAGLITPTYSIDAKGYWVLPGTTQRYRDWKKTGHGITDLHKAIVESVDTYFYELAYRFGIDKLASYMTKFGFGSKTGIDINEEAPGNFPTTQWKYKHYHIPWMLGDTPPVGIGQGYFTATPIQLAKALNTLINHGQVKTPHLVLNTDIHQPNTTVMNITTPTYPTSAIFQDAPQSYWTDVLNGMWGVVNQPNGSGYLAFRGAPYEAAGKTGTAQIFNLHGSIYNASTVPYNLRDNSLFVAFAPYNNPQISVVVIVEHGGSGARAAAPIARKIIDYYLLTRLPQMNPKLTCVQQQYYAVLDLINLGIKVNATNDIYNLKNLAPQNSICQVDPFTQESAEKIEPLEIPSNYLNNPETSGDDATNNSNDNNSNNNKPNQPNQKSNQQPSILINQNKNSPNTSSSPNNNTNKTNNSSNNNNLNNSNQNNLQQPTVPLVPDTTLSTSLEN